MLTFHTDLLFTSCDTYGPGLLGANLKTISVEDTGISPLVWNIWNLTISLMYLNMSVLMQLNTIGIVYSGNNKEVLPWKTILDCHTSLHFYLGKICS